MGLFQNKINILVKGIFPSMCKCNRQYFFFSDFNCSFSSKSSNRKGFLLTSAGVTGKAGEQRRAVPRIALRRGWGSSGGLQPPHPLSDCRVWNTSWVALKHADSQSCPAWPRIKGLERWLCATAPPGSAQLHQGQAQHSWESIPAR